MDNSKYLNIKKEIQIENDENMTEIEKKITKFICKVVIFAIAIEFIIFFIFHGEFLFVRYYKLQEFEIITSFAPKTFYFFIIVGLCSCIITFIKNKSNIKRAVINSITIVLSIFFVIFLISNINLIGCGENSFYDFGFPHWLFMALVIFVQITIFLFAYNYLIIFSLMMLLTYEPPKENS